MCVCVCRGDGARGAAVANSFRHGCDRYEQKSPTSIFKHLTARRWKGGKKRERERERGEDREILEIRCGMQMREGDEERGWVGALGGRIVGGRGGRGGGRGAGGGGICTGMQVGCEIARATLERTAQLSPSDDSRAFVATLQ